MIIVSFSSSSPRTRVSASVHHTKAIDYRLSHSTMRTPPVFPPSSLLLYCCWWCCWYCCRCCYLCCQCCYLCCCFAALLFRCAAVSLRHLLSGAAVRYCCQCCCQCCYLRTHTLIGRSASGRVSLLDMRTGLLNVRWRAHEGDVTQVMAGVNGRLVTASSDHTCTLWNADDAMAVTRFKGANTVHECRHSPFPLTTGRLAPAIGIIEPGRTMRVCCEGLWWRCARIPVFGHRALMTWLIAAMLSIVPARALLVTLCLPPMSFRH